MEPLLFGGERTIRRENRMAVYPKQNVLVRSLRCPEFWAENRKMKREFPGNFGGANTGRHLDKPLSRTRRGCPNKTE